MNPSKSNIYSLGNPAKQWKDLYVSDNIYINNSKMGLFILSLDETYMFPKDVSDVVLIGDSVLPADPSNIFQVSGNAYFTGDVTGNAFIAFSDKRLKIKL